VTVLRIRGLALPEGEPVDLYADGDRWTSDPVAGAELVAEGWILPGLVDAHTHPGAEVPGRPLDDDTLRDDQGRLGKPRAVIVRGRRVLPRTIR
jgi:cytosine/adenosine deaminase-related metal-dependent hydrolase